MVHLRRKSKHLYKGEGSMGLGFPVCAEA